MDTTTSIALLVALASGAACTSLAPDLPYDPNDRRIDTGETLPDFDCGGDGATPDAFHCTCSEACASGLCLTEEASLSETGYGIAQGQCLHACMAEADCDVDYACVGSGPSVGVCYLRCETPDDCPVANTCGRPFGEGSPRVCIPLCQDDIDCRSGACDRYTGSCGGMSDDTLGGLSADCMRASECRGDSCLVAGVCSAHCSIERQGCPEDGVCIDEGDMDDAGVCLKRCIVDSDCPHVPRRCVFWPEAGARGCL